MISLTFSGCYTYFPVEVDELQKIEEGDKVNIVLKTEEKVFMDSIKTVEVKEDHQIEFVKIDSTKISYSLDDIKELRIEKYDYGKVFFTVIWGGMGALLVIAGVFSIIYPDGLKQ